jgi:hypothetical protein
LHAYRAPNRVGGDSKLTITGITELGFNTTLIIENGGELVVDGGEIKYGNIAVNSGGEITIENGGIVDLHHIDDTFKVKSGGLLEFESGRIGIIE